jgi:hypothetical protein
MHQLYFVLIDAKNSKEATKNATEWLNENNFCSDSQGFYGSAKGDWYEVGGRWQTVIPRAHATATKSPAVEVFSILVAKCERNSVISKNWEALRDRLMKDIPCAAPFTKELKDALVAIKDYGTCEVVDVDEYEEVLLKDLDPDPKRFLVQIDYHS